jgi:hypothetical protein
MEFMGECFVVNDFNIHALNVGPFRSLELLVENPFKKCDFFAFLNKKGIINFFFWEKMITLRKKRRFYKWTFALIFSVFCFVL